MALSAVVLPIPPDEDEDVTLMERFKFLRCNHMKALIWKNFLWMWRNVGVMLFVCGLPMMEIIIFCLTIGHDPKGLKFAVLNEELNGSLMCPETLQKGSNEMLGCRFLKEIEKKVGLVYQNDEADGKELVRRGKAWGFVQIPQNFSQSLNDRVDMGKDANKFTIEYSNINIWMDTSDQQIMHLLNRDIYKAFTDFAHVLAADLGVDTRAALPPIRINEPIYGDREPNFNDFAAPGVILSVIFFLAVASTSGAILMERNEGLLERTLVLGITPVETLFGHVVTQFAIMLIQSILVLVFTFAVFSVTNRGDIFLVFFLVALTGICGMCFGFVVSCAVDNERSATYLSLGSFLPFVMLCGIIWPVQGMHFSLQFISMFLPLTKSTESLRSIMQRSWSFSKPTVYLGFVSTFVWIALFMSASIFVLKFKKG